MHIICFSVTFIQEALQSLSQQGNSRVRVFFHIKRLNEWGDKPEEPAKTAARLRLGGLGPSLGPPAPPLGQGFHSSPFRIFPWETKTKELSPEKETQRRPFEADNGQTERRENEERSQRRDQQLNTEIKEKKEASVKAISVRQRERLLSLWACRKPGTSRRRRRRVPELRRISPPGQEALIFLSFMCLSSGLGLWISFFQVSPSLGI